MVWKWLRIPQEELDDVATVKDVWVSLLSVTPLRSSLREVFKNEWNGLIAYTKLLTAPNPV